MNIQYSIIAIFIVAFLLFCSGCVEKSTATTKSSSEYKIVNCPNPDCPTHYKARKDIDMEVVSYDQGFRYVYLCLYCGARWQESS